MDVQLLMLLMITTTTMIMPMLNMPLMLNQPFQPVMLARGAVRMM